ncbi:MAG TPA: methionine adenosyltransferase [Chloroflexota bacterium]|nr:methionine adenosyltransferase [Chloroflexota bacterium]
MSQSRFFTSNSVMLGHPDKLCDRISDALVDAHLSMDPEARIRAEVAAAGQLIFLVTDVDIHGEVDVTGVVRRAIAETGYFPADMDPDRCAILSQSSRMTPLGASVSAGPEVFTEEGVATEQTTVFGYACSETPERMPLPIQVAHRLSVTLSVLAQQRTIPGLGPDGDVQVTVEYDGNRPIRIDTMVIQLQHRGNPSDLRESIQRLALDPVTQSLPVKPDSSTRLILNPAGPLEVAGPARDAGHTGRKNADDSYGGAARHGGHSLSGKDPGRLDRSASYAARHVATNVVAAGLATECELMLSYAIGQTTPSTVFARTLGTGVISDERLSEIVGSVFDLRPGAIVKRLGLRQLPREKGGRFYQLLAVGGHFGRIDLDPPWELTDHVDALREAARV